ncbi:MAG: protein BatD, partial [Bacteroidales bacterium]|nr:protein BatD [Bacteroidales bacterium]
SDKLSIPLAELTREKVIAVLQEKNVEAGLATSCIEVLNECEFARYAPNAGQQQRDQLYAEAARVISDLENVIKN